MAPKTPTLQNRTPSPEEVAQLTHLSSLLHLLHHRNKNQHGRSIWYRHFSLFRRHLAALLADYTTLTTVPATNLERTRLKALTPTLQARITQRLELWKNVLVARWMRAFSQVVADGRFSVLGLVMLGVLGGVCKVVGVAEGLENEGQEEVERVLEEFGREVWGPGGGDEGEVVARADDEGEVVVRVDEGEAVARDDEHELSMELGEDLRARETPDGPPCDYHEPQCKGHGTSALKTFRQPSLSPPPKAAKIKSTSTKKRSADTKAKPAKKKRKKGGDAIDDLFSGL